MLQLTPSLPRTDTLFTVTTRSRSRPGRREHTGHGGRLMSLPSRFAPQALLRLAAGLLVAAVVIVVVTVPLDLESQWIFALTTMAGVRSEEHTSELQSLMRTSSAVFCLNKKNTENPKNRQKQP